jgi:Flp pilus assembly protein TadD
MAISEIEKLERRYAENPQGLTFAPLAEAYRKTGDAERALAILRPGLELHPDYIPASIVLGRCQLDLGDAAGAEAAFGHVLSLDPENVIALKALADLTERDGRFAESAERLRVLLDVDRSNDEAREQLARVEAAALAAPAPEPAEALEAVAESEGEAVADAPSDEEAGAAPAETFVATMSTGFGDTLGEIGEIELSESAELPEASRAEGEPLVERRDDGPMLPEMREEEPAAPQWTPVPLDAVAEDVVVLEPAAPDEPRFGAVETAADLELRSAGANEFQLPSATDALQAAGNASSEFQLPDASADFIAHPAEGGTASEYQAPDAAESLLADVVGEPVEPEPEAAPVPDVELVPEGMLAFAGMGAIPEAEPEPAQALEPDEPAGVWETWSDAALADDAEPFAEDEPVAMAEPAAMMPALDVVAVPEPVAEQLESAIEQGAPPAELVEEIVAVQAEALVEESPSDAAPEWATPEASVPGDAAPEAEAAAAALPPERPLPAPEEVEPDLVVTESMAELFVRQGHAADALRVYRELASRRPGDARLAARIAELEQQEAAARAPLAPYSARVTGGTSVRELMQTLLATRPDGAAPTGTPVPSPMPASPADAAPTRPASDHLSLSDVFGEEGPPLPPAFRSSRPPTEEGVSFDEFFGGEGTRAEGGEPARAARAPRPGDDDLDQFHAWLQNLKR